MFNSIVFMARYSSSLVLPFDLPGGNVYARKLSSSGIHFFLCILILTRNLTKKCEKECVEYIEAAWRLHSCSKALQYLYSNGTNAN